MARASSHALMAQAAAGEAGMARHPTAPVRPARRQAGPGEHRQA